MRKFCSLWFRFIYPDELIYSHSFSQHVWLLTLQLCSSLCPCLRVRPIQKKWAATQMSKRQHIKFVVQNQGQHSSLPMFPSICVKKSPFSFMFGNCNHCCFCCGHPCTMLGVSLFISCKNKRQWVCVCGKKKKARPTRIKKKKKKKEITIQYGDVCIRIADSLCYKAETNTPL